MFRSCTLFRMDPGDPLLLEVTRGAKAHRAASPPGGDERVYLAMAAALLVSPTLFFLIVVASDGCEWIGC